jgi:hypothetical protein
VKVDENSREITARQKHACPTCGGAAEWNPAKQALVCPFCNTVLPPPLPGEGQNAAPDENDLASALNAIGDDQRGWQAQKTSVKCQSCEAISVFDPTRVAQRCEFCGSASLIPYDEIKAPIRPTSLLEFKIPETAVRDIVRKWYGGRWFAPNAMSARSLTDTVRGVYIPYWTFDAHVAADWTADAGYHYYETESYTDSNGRTQTRQVQKTRWEPAAGSIEHFFDDELVPASRGIDETLLRKIEPFPTTTDLKPYDPSFLSGWVVEQYQIDLVAAAQKSRETMEGKTRDLCSAEVPGDTQRNLEVDADFSGQTFKHILVPIWLIAYTYGAKTFQVVVNGYTGTIAGRHPMSWIKVGLAVLAALVLLIIILTLSSR